ncbi:MAG: hypothetical protein QF554_00340 [Dehalococcoidia bacterium]|jgi:hypothetical protein|nr:hypothetical protein [Dehalococcoidia bacterium]
MRITPNRVEKFFLAAPLWHALILAIAVGAPAGFVAATTSIERWVIWLAGLSVALSALTLDALLRRHIGWRHTPGTWTRHRTRNQATRTDQAGTDR